MFSEMPLMLWTKCVPVLWEDGNQGRSSGVMVWPRQGQHWCWQPDAEGTWGNSAPVPPNSFARGQVSLQTVINSFSPLPKMEQKGRKCGRLFPATRRNSSSVRTQAKNHTHRVWFSAEEPVWGWINGQSHETRLTVSLKRRGWVLKTKIPSPGHTRLRTLCMCGHGCLRKHMLPIWQVIYPVG